LNQAEPKPFLFFQTGSKSVLNFGYGLVVYRVIRILSGVVRFDYQFGTVLLVFLNNPN
jgi:hypothetical protein